MKKIKFRKACLIGVGLIGGSLAKDLVSKKITTQVFGFDTHLKNLKYAVQNKIVTGSKTSLKQTLSKVDLVILAVPVLAIETLIKELAPFISDHTLVIDTGSTKQKIIKLSDQYFLNGNFVGCHPMAGLESSGAKSSVNGLFKGASCLIVKGKKTKQSFVNKAKQLWSMVGAKPVELSVLKHDRYMAACSHLPHVLSFSLMSSVGSKIKARDLKKVSGASFKSYTRIAGSNASMWADIFLDNQKHILNQIKAFKKDLTQLETAIENKEFKKMFSYIKDASEMWKQI